MIMLILLSTTRIVSHKIYSVLMVISYNLRHNTFSLLFCLLFTLAQVLDTSAVPAVAACLEDGTPAVAAVAAGLEDGTLLVFFGSSPLEVPLEQRLSWRERSYNLCTEEHQTHSIKDIITVSSKEIWCSFGGDIVAFELDAASQTIKRLDNIAFGDNAIRPDLSVVSLLKADGYVWATIYNQNVLLKISISDRLLLGCFQMNAFDQTTPSTLALSPSLPSKVLMKYYRPPSISVRRPSEGSKGDGVTIEKASAALLCSGACGSSDENARDSPMANRQMQLQQQRSIPATPDSIVSVRSVKDTIWISLLNGSVLVLSSVARTVPEAMVADAGEPASSPGNYVASAFTPLQDVAEESGSKEVNLPSEKAEQEATVSGPEARTGSFARQRRYGRPVIYVHHGHTLLGRLNLVPRDENEEHGVRHMTVTPSNLVVTSRVKSQIPATSPDGRAIARDILPLYTWDAWSEEQWHHYYDVISQL